MAWNFLYLKGRNCRACAVLKAEDLFGAENLTWYTYLNEMMDLRSFSNLWFWIALAVMWSTASHWVLGVPYDMVTRAARDPEGAQADLEQIAYGFVRRRLYVTNVAGTWATVFTSFVLSSLLILGWGYNIEFAQALALLGTPMTLVGYLSHRAAARIDGQGLRGADLRKVLTRLRMTIQAIGMVSIFVTSVWGIYVNLVRHLDNDLFKVEEIEPTDG
ncbi:hypothetical protein SAMN05421685_108137 [Thalassovita mediterranea]|nr:hypothetical protein SAMN05421685_108137 [Thalassovita mediterranea]